MGRGYDMVFRNEGGTTGSFRANNFSKPGDEMEVGRNQTTSGCICNFGGFALRTLIEVFCLLSYLFSLFLPVPRF